MDSKEALQQIKGLAQSGSYRLTWHAEERMVERGATPQDIKRALIHAFRCTSAEKDCWKVTGKDTENDDLSMIVAIEERLVIVTVLSD